MPNAVYTQTFQALAQSVSERGAEALLLAALRERGLSPDDVSAQQMQVVLSGTLVNRLSTILPPQRARNELMAISRQLAQSYPKSPTLFTDVGAFSDWDKPEETVSEWTGEGDLSAVSTPEQAISATPVTPATSAVPVGDFGSSSSAAGATGLDGFDTDGFDTDGFEADDFEFDDPEYAATLQSRAYALEDAVGQDAVIRDLGRMQGVMGVVVTRNTGELLRVKAMRDASKLGSVIAATALLFRQRGLKLMSADLGGQTICMRPLGDYCVTVIAGPQVNIGRLLGELQQLEVAQGEQ